MAQRIQPRLEDKPAKVFISATTKGENLSAGYQNITLYRIRDINLKEENDDEKQMV
jgi:hypothetical protein